MAYNPYIYNGYYNNPYQQQQQYYQQQQPAQQLLTPPTIHAEIIQIDDISAADVFPVGAGQSQMMMTRDDSAIIIKSALANGQTTLTVYKRQTAEPKKPEINLDDYITRAEFEQRISAIIPTPKTNKRKEDAEQ